MKKDPSIYLSYSERGWILINQGSPLCDYKKTKAEVMEVVKFFKITLPDCTWNGDRGEFVVTDTIEEIHAS
jgi:hypothetical protein